MRLKTLGAVALVLCALSARPSMQTMPGRFTAGEILVKFAPNANAAARAAAHTDAGGAPSAEIQRTRVQRVRVSAGTEAAVIARYRRNPDVLYAEPNYVRRLPDPVNR